MSNKQFFAQIGVFLLVCLNVTAYYFFWPANDERSSATVEASAERKNLQFTNAEEQEVWTVPGNKIQPPAIDHPAPKFDGSLPPPASVPESAWAPSIPRPESDLATKIQQSPWLLNMEVVGTQTQLIARLRQQSAGLSPAEFKILCDRVDMQAAEGAVQAVGKVTFFGPGLKGTCQRLTVPVAEMRIIFEESVEVTHQGPPDTRTAYPYILRGEKIVWELPEAVRAAAMIESEVRPARFTLPLPPAEAISLPTLGAPR
jgi:hypothetical protein